MRHQQCHNILDPQRGDTSLLGAGDPAECLEDLPQGKNMSSGAPREWTGEVGGATPTADYKIFLSDDGFWLGRSTSWGVSDILP